MHESALAWMKYLAWPWCAVFCLFIAGLPLCCRLRRDSTFWAKSEELNEALAWVVRQSMAVNGSQ